MTLPNPSDRQALRAWLKERPREEIVAFAARAALRVLPLVVDSLGTAEDPRRAIVLPVFRGTTFAWLASHGSNQSVAEV
ncbi:MAG: hypothetical protein AAFV86_13300, partial [Pseudomonadota bacterium]